MNTCAIPIISSTVGSSFMASWTTLATITSVTALSTPRRVSIARISLLALSEITDFD